MAKKLDKIKDQELQEKIVAVESRINRLRNLDEELNFQEIYQLEVELMYMLREEEIRNNRRAMHDKYMRAYGDFLKHQMREEEEATRYFLDNAIQGRLPIEMKSKFNKTSKWMQ